MHSMLRFLQLLIGVALIGHIAQANDLKQLYELAKSNDTTLQAAQFQRDAAIEVRPQALAPLLPQVSGSGSAIQETSSTPGVNAAQCVSLTVAGTQRCSSTVRGLNVTLSQTLWSAQAFNQLKEANFQAAAAEATFRGTQESLILRVALAYFGILAATDQLEANRAAREAFGMLLHQATVRQQTGVGPRSDVAEAQAFYDVTKQNVIDAENLLDDADLALTEIVGDRPNHISPLREDIPLSPPDPASAEDWVVSARKDNFDVRAAQLNVEAASRDISVQRGRGLPTLMLTGSASKTLQNEAFGDTQRLDTVGVSISWPLLQGGAVASAVRQSRALYRQAQVQFDAKQRDTERQTRAAFRNVVSGVQRVMAGERAVASGRDAVEAARRALEFGTGKEFDLLNTQNNYYAAIRAYSQDRYDYLSSVLTLKQQAGRLSERELAAVDDLLLERSP
jgi:outer membrane protein